MAVAEEVQKARGGFFWQLLVRTLTGLHDGVVMRFRMRDGVADGMPYARVLVTDTWWQDDGELVTLKQDQSCVHI